jgi:hypothetical protein
MTKKTTVKTLLIIAATTLGVATTALAQTAPGSMPTTTVTTDAPPTAARYGLLGERYAGVDYGYTHIHNSYLDNLNGFDFRYNQPMEPGFDFSLGYDWARSNEYGNVRAREEQATASVTAFTDFKGMRAFIEPGVGWTWSKTGASASDSFLWFVGTGVEFQVMPRWVVTPYVRFDDATSHNRTSWNFGIKSAYRLTKSWGLNVDLTTDDDNNSGYTAGVNYHF